MPLYDFKCEKCESITSELMKVSDDKDNLVCTSKLDCGGKLEQQFGMVSKPLVVDRDLALARNHNGKKW